jgi:hypothetical protein
VVPWRSLIDLLLGVPPVVTHPDRPSQGAVDIGARHFRVPLVDMIPGTCQEDDLKPVGRRIHQILHAYLPSERCWPVSPTIVLVYAQMMPARGDNP